MKQFFQLNYLKGIQISTDRGKQKKCSLCHKDFGFLLKEHQCKRCKRAVCEKCSPHKALTLGENGPTKEMHRQCNFCKEENDHMKKFIEQYRIGFLTDTLSIEWLKSFGLDKESARNDYDEAQKNNDNHDQTELKKMQSQINLVFQELQMSFNYSLREFFYQALKDIEQDLINASILRVLQTFLAIYPQVGYSHDQVMIILFLLCFCSEASAFTLLTLLYAEMIPSYLYPVNLKVNKYDYTTEIEKTIYVLTKTYKMQQSDTPIIKTFLKNRFQRYEQSLTINFLLFETTFFIVNQMFTLPKVSQETMIKSLAIAFSNHLTDFRTHLTNQDEMELIILRQVKASTIQDGYFKTKSLEIPEIQQPTVRKSQILTRQRTIIVQDETGKNRELVLQLQDENAKLHIANEKLHADLKYFKEQIDQFQHQINDNMVELHKNDEQVQQIEAGMDILLATQDDEFKNLRRSLEIISQSQKVNQDVFKLKLYIDKLELAYIQSNKDLQEKVEQSKFQVCQIAQINQSYSELQHQFTQYQNSKENDINQQLLIKDRQIQENKEQSENECLQLKKQLSDSNQNIISLQEQIKEIQIKSTQKDDHITELELLITSKILEIERLQNNEQTAQIALDNILNSKDNGLEEQTKQRNKLELQYKDQLKFVDELKIKIIQLEKQIKQTQNQQDQVYQLTQKVQELKEELQKSNEQKIIVELQVRELLIAIEQQKTLEIEIRQQYSVEIENLMFKKETELELLKKQITEEQLKTDQLLQQKQEINDLKIQEMKSQQENVINILQEDHKLKVSEMETSLNDKSQKQNSLEDQLKEISQQLAQSQEEKSDHLRKIEELLFLKQVNEQNLSTLSEEKETIRAQFGKLQDENTDLVISFENFKVQKEEAIKAFEILKLDLLAQIEEYLLGQKQQSKEIEELKILNLELHEHKILLEKKIEEQQEQNTRLEQSNQDILQSSDKELADKLQQIQETKLLLEVTRKEELEQINQLNESIKQRELEWQLSSQRQQEAIEAYELKVSEMETSLNDKSQKQNSLEDQLKEISQQLAQSQEEKSDHLRKIQELLLLKQVNEQNLSTLSEEKETIRAQFGKLQDENTDLVSQFENFKVQKEEAIKAFEILKLDLLAQIEEYLLGQKQQSKEIEELKILNLELHEHKILLEKKIEEQQEQMEAFQNDLQQLNAQLLQHQNQAKADKNIINEFRQQIIETEKENASLLEEFVHLEQLALQLESQKALSYEQTTKLQDANIQINNELELTAKTIQNLQLQLNDQRKLLIGDQQNEETLLREFEEAKLALRLKSEQLDQLTLKLNSQVNEKNQYIQSAENIIMNLELQIQTNAEDIQLQNGQNQELKSQIQKISQQLQESLEQIEVYVYQLKDKENCQTKLQEQIQIAEHKTKTSLEEQHRLEIQLEQNTVQNGQTFEELEVLKKENQQLQDQVHYLELLTDGMEDQNKKEEQNEAQFETLLNDFLGIISPKFNAYSKIEQMVQQIKRFKDIQQGMCKQQILSQDSLLAELTHWLQMNNQFIYPMDQERINLVCKEIQMNKYIKDQLILALENENLNEKTEYLVGICLERLKKSANIEEELKSQLIYIQEQNQSLENQVQYLELALTKLGAQEEEKKFEIRQNVLQIVQKIPQLTEQQIFSFSDKIVQSKGNQRQDEEDIRNLLEAKNHQVQWLKQLLKEKQNQLGEMNTYIQQLRNYLS